MSEENKRDELCPEACCEDKETEKPGTEGAVF